MRNTLPLLSRPPVTATPPQPASAVIPSIRLISATPSATGMSSEASTSAVFSADSSWASIPSPLAPRADAVAPRKRLVPKKSKLSLLTVGRDKEKGKVNDFSDVVRRVGGGTASTKGGFEIYVDPAEDVEVGEIMLVKKKKSRAALDGLRWGALGEVTNVPSTGPKEASTLLKVKGEEKDKWWSIGRGRKESKDKTKETKSKTNAKTPEPTQEIQSRPKISEPLKSPQESRARFNSLDSGIMLAPIATIPECEDAQPIIYSRSGTPTAGGLLVPPGGAPGPNQGSIAIRAMRSVRSLARIGSWAQLKNGSAEEKENAPKERQGKDKKEPKEKGGEKKKTKKKLDKPQAQTLRNSTSSFEVGALTASPGALTAADAKSLGKKKHSILGIGLPSTMRLPTVRGGSTASSTMVPAVNRLSVESAALMMGRDRAASTVSTASSLRPISVASSTSRTSTGSSAASVRWDEAGLQTVKAQRKKDRESKKEGGEIEKTGKKGEKESRRSLEGRKRTPLTEVFPDVQPLSETEQPESPVFVRAGYPIVRVEEATSDGHSMPDDLELLEESEGPEKPVATPMKRARARPLSEQLLGRSRPQGMYENEDGVLSILDAATNDLAQLINHLDLEATPGTPDMTPLRPSPFSTEKTDSPTKKQTLALDSPLKKSLRASMASISSLRPYAQSRANNGKSSATTLEFIGQPIAPWPTLLQGLSPVKKSPVRPKPAAAAAAATPVFRLTHKRTMTPAPDPDPSPVFQPLRPAKSRPAMEALALSNSPEPLHDGTIRAPSSLTFGGSRSSKGSYDEVYGSSLTPSPVFTRASHTRRKRSSLVPGDRSSNGSQGSQISRATDRDSVPIPPEARRVLGMAGTMGGSDVSGYAVPELDASDPDSDIPDELQFILSENTERRSLGGDDDTYSTYHNGSPPPSPGLPPFVPLPLAGPLMVELPSFHLIDEDENQADIDEGGNTSEEDTKKSFDFTGELKKLNESGGSDRASFVEQLENAFRTPAKVDLRYNFGGLLNVEIPPVPKLPLDMRMDTSESGGSSFGGYSGDSQIVDVKEPTFLAVSGTDSSAETKFEVCSSASRIIDTKEPTLLPGSDSLGNDETEDVAMEVDSPRSLRTSSSGSRPSDGQLNTAFKFGGRPQATTGSEQQQQQKPMTLSDIIPSPAHARSLSLSSVMEEDDSVLKSIFAQAAGIPAPRARLDSEASFSLGAPEFPRGAAAAHRRTHSRQSSISSFSGFDSFDEVRRGFEFSNNRPAFYPPPGAGRRGHHGKHDSVFSIASVSSYGRVVNPGSVDPFDYGLPSLRERPSSEDMSVSMSMSVDDTFSFLGRARQRRRVDSDASSFYFKAPMHARGHRRHESNMSVASLAPPISLYNRSFGAHRRNDSSTSMSSVAQSYAMHGANGGRAAWARHRQDASMDSIMSDFSALRLGRPGIGDKMFDTAVDARMPLTAISASPPESVASRNFGHRSSYDFDSILDDERRSSMEDSLFEKTGHRTSVSSDDSVFGYDEGQAAHGGLLPPHQFRPLSVLSMNSIHSPMKEDDTMISMLGGGHARRRSVGSIIDTSPCVRVEKRKQSNVQQLRGGYEEFRDSPNKARIIEKPSIASTSSYKFGGERMIKAQRGLLARQSLEDSCLIADGEDLSTSFRTVPVFTRPGPATRSRSSTCTSSSGGDTPPLSSSDGSSISEGSQSSIDLSHVNFILANATHPMSMSARTRARTRARGHGHRRRLSQAHASRSSVYETIEEERSTTSSPATSKKSSPTVCQPIFIVEPDTASVTSIPEETIWDDERGITALRKYYALRDEAKDTVTESQRQWSDTAFSVFALQAFQPPRHPAGMQALLEHSVQNYGPLPSDLRPRRVRSRTQSRPSPYPQARISKVSPITEQTRPSVGDLHLAFNTPPVPVLQQLPVHNPNVLSAAAPALDFLKPFSPLNLDVEPKRENAFGLAPAARPRVGSTARRTALGWAKRSTGKSSTDQKENIGQGTVMTPGESLRISRPRPRGRPTPASHQRPIRI